MGTTFALTPRKPRRNSAKRSVKLDLARRKKELDELRGAASRPRKTLRAFQEKNLEYKRLQGALPSP